MLKGTKSSTVYYVKGNILLLSLTVLHIQSKIYEHMLHQAIICYIINFWLVMSFQYKARYVSCCHTDTTEYACNPYQPAFLYLSAEKRTQLAREGAWQAVQDHPEKLAKPECWSF